MGNSLLGLLKPSVELEGFLANGGFQKVQKLTHLTGYSVKFGVFINGLMVKSGTDELHMDVRVRSWSYQAPWLLTSRIFYTLRIEEGLI